MTPEEIEYRDNENAAKWELCKEVYRQHGRPIISNHTHSKHKTHRPSEVREDLIVNRCRNILKEIWD